MGILNKKGGIYRKGLKAKSQSSVKVGGADLSDVKSKRIILEEQAEEIKKEMLIEAQQLIDDAKEQAESMIQEAQAQVLELEAEAHKKGFQEGKEEGQRAIEEEMGQYLQDAQSILEAIETEREEALAEEEGRILAIILQLAKKLIKQELKLNKEVSLEFIQNAIKHIENKAEVTLYLDENSAKILNKERSRLLDNCPGLENLVISNSKQLEPGDLIVETNRERLDLRLEAQLDELLNNSKKEEV